MSKGIFADTGPLYALADPSDQYHVRAQAQLDRLTSAGEFVATTYLTLAEAYTLVLRRLGRSYALEWLEQVTDGAMLINPEPRDYVKASSLIMTFRDQPVTIFDAVAATVSERLSLRVWTYDRRFDLLGVKRWT